MKAEEFFGSPALKTKRNGRAEKAPQPSGSPADLQKMAEQVEDNKNLLHPHMLKWRPFPLASLPGPAVDYARAVAAAMNVDEAMLAVLVLPVLAVAVGNSRRVRVKRGWKESATLWVIILGRSGVRKSPVLAAVLKPIYALERELKVKFEEAERTSGSSGNSPVRSRLRLSDTTLEGALQVLSENPRGVLLARDEAGGWLGSFDRYARGEADLQGWIEFYEGRYVQVDRKSAARVLDVYRPSVSVVGGIQPGILQRKISKQHISSGFLARLLLAHPPERPRRWTDAEISAEVQERYDGLIRRLYDIPLKDEPGVLPLTAEARRAFARWVNMNASVQEQLPEGPLRATLSKIEAVAARLALIFEVADNPQAEAVGPGAAERGIRVARWLRREAARVYHRLGIREHYLDKDERLVLKLPRKFTWEEVRDLWGVKRRAAFDVLDRLQEKGFACREEHGSYVRTDLMH